MNKQQFEDLVLRGVDLVKDVRHTQPIEYLSGIVATDSDTWETVWYEFTNRTCPECKSKEHYHKVFYKNEYVGDACEDCDYLKVQQDASFKKQNNNI
jgi:hypothetical protein